MAQGNGDFVGEIGSFSWLWHRRLQMLEADGGNVDDLRNLREKVLSLDGLLYGFHSHHKSLAESGRYTAAGLADEVAGKASDTAGAIRRLCDSTLIDQAIVKTSAKLQAKAAADPIDRLLHLMQMQEIRSELQSRGITGGDTLSGDVAYREAASRKDYVTMQAMEEWPLQSPVSESLIVEGRAMRLGSVDPIAARKLSEEQTFKESLQQAEHDALLELRDFLPVDDPIARQAQGEPDDAA